MAKSDKSFNLSKEGFIRLAKVLEIFPVSKSTWWSGIKKGKYPKPIKISERCSAWKLSDIENLITHYETANEE